MNFNFFKSKAFLVFASAIFLAVITAYFSIFGLSKLFAGEATKIILMGSAIELAKIVAVSYVYRYWKKIGAGLKIFMISMILGAMILTSGGSYGFLTSAFQSTVTKYEASTLQDSILIKKQIFYKDQIESLNSSITITRNELNQEINSREKIQGSLNKLRNDSLTNVVRNQIVSTQKDKTFSDDNIQQLRSTIIEYEAQKNEMNDSILSLNLKQVELKSKDEITEFGPLIYMTRVFNKPMNNVINWFVFLIMLILDPFAIGLFILFNRIQMEEAGITQSTIKPWKFPKWKKSRKIEPEPEKEDVFTIIEKEKTTEPTTEIKIDKITNDIDKVRIKNRPHREN